MDGVGAAGGCGSAGNAGGHGRADAAAKCAEKSACKKAETPNAAAQGKASKSYGKDEFVCETPQGQRDKALAVTREAPPGSVGAAINPLLEAATSVTRNDCAGTVGDFYEQQRELLNSPATEQNIRDFSRRETDFFETQLGCARDMGRLMDAETRETLIGASRDVQSLPDRAREALRSIFGW